MPEEFKQYNLKKDSSERSFQQQVNESIINLLSIEGFIETVTTIPSGVPRRLQQQIKIYIDDVSSPTTKRLYIYSNKTNTWHYITIDS